MKNIQFLFISIAMFVNSMLIAQRPYITIWKTDNAGISATNQISLPATGSFSYTWENESTPAISGTGSGSGTITITFPSAGYYRLRISPVSYFSHSFPQVETNGDCKKLIRVEQWGDVQWGPYMNYFFNGCSNLVITAADIPNLNNVTMTSGMFQGCSSITTVPNMNNWNVSNVTQMGAMFYGASSFNEDIGNWNVSNVTWMNSMFRGATAFNKNIGNWNTGKVQAMASLFSEATSFNQPIGNWNTSNVTDMSNLFILAPSFNQPLSNWNTAKVTSMAAMFNRASSFNQPIGNWNTSLVKNMSTMFYGANAFNQPIGNWNTSGVTDMNSMFNGASAFNQPVGNWNTGSVTDMRGLFANATSFNQPIGSWNTSAVTYMTGMFMRAGSFNQPVGNWNTGNVTDMKNMFQSAQSFNQSVDNWNTQKVIDMSYIFNNAAAFNQSLGRWDVPVLTKGDWMFSGAGLDCNNYSKTLIGWADKPSTPNNVSFVSQVGRIYGSQGQAARNALIAKGWTISGDAYDAGCTIVPDPTVEPSGSNPVEGPFITKVWLSGSQPPLFVKRHFEITPVNNAGNATGTVTLYFSNQDFKDFNNQSPAPALLLPDISDPATVAARKANLRIEKRGGVSSDGSGLPNTYPGAVLTIDPADENIIWDAGENYWLVKFDVTGFSGFWLKTTEAVLPVTFGDITAVLRNGNLMVGFTTLNEVNNSYFDIEVSLDGVAFNKVATIKSKHADGNSSQDTTYSVTLKKTAGGAFMAISFLFVLAAFGSGTSYHRRNRMLILSIGVIAVVGLSIASCKKQKDTVSYTGNEKVYVRIAQVDKDGKVSYSKVITAITE